MTPESNEIELSLRQLIDWANDVAKSYFREIETGTIFAAANIAIAALEKVIADSDSAPRSHAKDIHYLRYSSTGFVISQICSAALTTLNG